MFFLRAKDYIPDKKDEIMRNVSGSDCFDKYLHHDKLAFALVCFPRVRVTESICNGCEKQDGHLKKHSRYVKSTSRR
jgi:hypothetical protein